MLIRLFLLAAMCISAGAVSKPGSTEQLQRLARLPKLEFAPPLEFNRHTGWVVCPETSSLNQEAGKLQLKLKDSPNDAATALRLGRLYDQLNNYPMALRYYIRAAAIYRAKLEVEADNPSLLTGLAEALYSQGQFSQALPNLEKAIILSRDKPEVWVALGRFHQERAWRTVVPEEQFYDKLSFLEMVEEAIPNSLDPSKMDEAKKELDLAHAAFNQAIDLAPDNATFYVRRSIFHSLRHTLLTAFREIQNGPANHFALQFSISNSQSLVDWNRAADLSKDDPSLVASAILLSIHAAMHEWRIPGDDLWKGGARILANELKDQISPYLLRLQTMGDHPNPETASRANEMLGAVRLFVFADPFGARKNFRSALDLDSKLERSWDLLTLSIVREGNLSDLVEQSVLRVSQSPSARNYFILAKAYERSGDRVKAEWITLTGLTLNSNDFYSNLSLANLLLKRADYLNLLGRVRDCISKAERYIGPNPSRQNYLDLALTKAIFHALSDETERARAIVKEFGSASPELEAVLVAIGH